METKILVILTLIFLEWEATIAQPVESNDDMKNGAAPDETTEFNSIPFEMEDDGKLPIISENDANLIDLDSNADDNDLNRNNRDSNSNNNELNQNYQDSSSSESDSDSTEFSMTTDGDEQSLSRTDNFLSITSIGLWILIRCVRLALPILFAVILHRYLYSGV